MGNNLDLKELEKLRKKYDFISDINYAVKLTPGIDEKKVRFISEIKNEPKWMLEKRLLGLKNFERLAMPDFGPKLSVDFEKLIYFAKAIKEVESNWEDLPENIKSIFDRLRIPEEEKKWLMGVGAQVDSEVVLSKIKDDLAKQGVIFMSMDEAVLKHPDLVKQYFGKLVGPGDHKFAALNWAAWSGGSFVYVPKGVKVKMPLQTYYRMNLMEIGQFERTLIIADEDSEVHFMEGCTAPLYSKASLHASIVEVFAKKNSKVRYSSVQNWSTNVYNLVTKRAIAEEGATIEWVAGNLGGSVVMGYPAVILKGNNSKADIMSVGMSGKGQNVDAGGKIIAQGNNTRGSIVSKSISLRGGKQSYRGSVKVMKNAKNANISVSCDSLLMDNESSSNTYPNNELYENATVKHEAKIGTIDDNAIFYLTSKGLSEKDAKAMIVLGFIDPITKELPLEYAIEFNKLVKMEIENGF